MLAPTYRWLTQRREQVPAELGWLSDAEADALSAFASPRRRADFLLGRWTAKRALFTCLCGLGQAPRLSELSILASPSGAPRVYLDGCPAPFGVSLSHREGIGLCVVGPATCSFGCDLEWVEPRSPAFVADFFTSEERARWEAAKPEERDRLACLVWSVKESALKALRQGLRLDTRSVVVEPFEGSSSGDDGWSPLRVLTPLGALSGASRLEEGYVLTLVAAGAISRIEELPAPRSSPTIPR